jgi:hypothetical protein
MADSSEWSAQSQELSRLRSLGENIGKSYFWASGKEKQNEVKNAKDGEITGYADFNDR